MKGQKVPKAPIANEEDAGPRRSSRNKTHTKDEQLPLKENEDQLHDEASPLSTKQSRNKYVRKPLHEYGKSTVLSSPHENDKNKSHDGYTRILPPNDSGNENYENTGQKHIKDYPFPTNDEGEKMSAIPHIENMNIDNVSSPPIGACKTSSPVNSTEIFEAPTSTIPRPKRTTRYNPKSSANSHEESYILSSSESRTRVQENLSVRHISMTEDDISEKLSRSKTNNSSLKSNLDFSHPSEHRTIIKSHQERENQDQEWKATMLNSVGILASAFVIVLIALLMNSNQIDNGVTRTRHSTKAVVNALKEMFPSQTEDTWKVIASNIKRINQKRSNQAACIVFVQNASDTTPNGSEKCIAAAIAKEISMLQTEGKSAVAHLNITVNSKDFRNDKAGLYSAVETSLSKNSVVTLFDINNLGGSSAMALHSFCDSDPTGGEDPSMAPYIHTAVLSTLKVTINSPTNDNILSDQTNAQGHVRKVAHTLAERELSSAWQPEIGEDKAASLISRVALNAVFLEPEKADIARRVCA